MTYERISAGMIRVGDTVARARTHPFHTVTEVRHGPVSVVLYTSDERDRFNGRRVIWARPRKTAQWWREVA